ncbi:MAG: hypothetical protein ACAF41_03730 [Leptolyngbya sp. BL-A-14]
MANSHVSYLHTLAKEEAIAFVTSLQKVKEHLSHELQWMNGQVQQKTIQLQGIDTLLSEAVGLGLLSPNAITTQPSTATDANSSSVAVDGQANLSQTEPSLPAILAAANGNSLAAETVASINTASGSSPEAVLSTPAAPPKRGRKPQATKASQGKRNAKQPAAEKTSAPKATTKASAPKATTAPAKKPGRAAKSSSEADGSASGFQQFVQPPFKDKSMTDAVGEILATAKEPMNTDAIMSKLYDGLSGEPYQRAKSSLSNILSVGKTKGKWKSPSRGLYLGS